MSPEEIAGIDTTIPTIDQVSGSDFPAATPAQAEPVSVTPNAVTKTVSAPNVSIQNAGVAPTVDYTGMTVSEELNDVSINRGAETLKQSVNQALGVFHSALNQALTGVSQETANAISSLVNDINNKFVSFKSESDTFAGDVNVQFTSLIGQMNTAFAIITQKEQEQSNAIAAKMNTLGAQTSAQTSKLQSVIEKLQHELVILNDTYATDSELAVKVANVNAIFEKLRGTDLDFVDALRQNVAEINAMERHKSKSILIAVSTGVHNFNLLGEGFPEAVHKDDFRVTLTVVDNIKVSAEYINKTKDGFDIKLMTRGHSLVAQPHDASVTPVYVEVVCYFDKKDPMTMNIDVLKETFVTSGAGTDATTI